jgi:uracil-DNA glycosylase
MAGQSPGSTASCCTPGESDLIIHLLRNGSNLKPTYRKNFAISELTSMTSLAYGIALLTQYLETLNPRNFRCDRTILDRIRSLRFDEPSSNRVINTDLPSDLLEETASSALVTAVTDAAERARLLAELRSQVVVCQKCEHLARFRHQVVFGVGNPQAELMFVGEAPGAEEDLRGEPFVGRAGELLTRILGTMGFKREDVFIANILKCRPDIPAGTPGNRPPTADEMATCIPYLRQQIELIQPKVIVALGGVAMRGLFGRDEPMKNLRGRWHKFGAIPVMATFHPSYILRNQSVEEKRKVWEDMLLVLEKLERPISERQRNFFSAKT